MSPHGSDGLAVAKANAPNGVANNAFVNSNDGTIQRIDTNTAGNPITVVASGGTRGDHVTTGPDGCLYPTQTDRVEKLAPCFFQAPPPVLMTGRAFGAAATLISPLGNLTVPPNPDTGFVSTTMASTTTTPCTASLAGPVSAHVLCANVTTTLGPPTSKATASIADATVGTGLTPLIQLTTIAASSTTSCAGSVGNATVATLKINGMPIAVAPGPNTVIPLPGGSIIINEQIASAGTLTVNAVHVHLKEDGLLTVDVILASATSDIHRCATTP